MKKHITHIVAIAVLGLVTFFAIPNRVQAAPVFKGQFTLTSDVVWNGTELPAGKYDFTLDSRAMSFYSVAKKAWVAEPSVFDVMVGASSRDIRLRGNFELAAR